MSEVESFDPRTPVTVTEAARNHFVARLAQTPEAKGVRISVKESGCSGYQYVIDYITEVSAEDGARTLADSYLLCVAPEAVKILNGTTIHLVKEGLNETIEFENPNVQSRCGCGESFSVDT
jgi:iron-sulfur cluster assembly accessory protein